MMGERQFPFQYFVFLIITVFLCSFTTAQIDFFRICVLDVGNFTGNSSFQTNLQSLLTTLPSNTGPYGFHTSDAGIEPDRAYAVTFCRADVDHDSCRRCVSNSIPKLLGLCPGSKEAMGWYEQCMLRYSSRPLTGWVWTQESVCVWNPVNATIPQLYNDAVLSLLSDLRLKAAAGGPDLKFAVGNSMGPNLQPIYAIVQCSPDLSEELCNSCLNKAFSLFSSCLSGRFGGRFMYPNCYFRFEGNSDFYNQTGIDALSIPNPPQSTDKRSSRRRRLIIILVSCSIAVVVIFMTVFSIWMNIITKRRLKQRNSLLTVTDTNDVSFGDTLHYEFNTIKEATNDFADENKLGQGGFGAVYKGRLANGQGIAVKRLSRGHGQGDNEFKNEVKLVGKLQHRNLVRLLGFSIEGTERLLVYELVDNSSLDKFLFDPSKGRLLDWERRYKIIRGVARGLVYLHEDSRHRVIHRDLKASNVLLDSNMNAKIADFGLAKLSETDETHGNTHIIAGTYGYMPPEYVMHGDFSVKSDVFSFGVLVLEIVSGQKNSSFQIDGNMVDLLTFAWERWSEGTISNLIDPRLRDAGQFIGDIIKCVHIGLLCCQSTVSERPSMGSVVVMLNSSSITLALPTKPSFFIVKRMDNNNTVSMHSNNDVSLSEIDPR